MTLVDTSAWIEALRKDGDPSVRAEVATLLETGKAVLPDIIILELWNGAHGEQERSRLEKLLSEELQAHNRLRRRRSMHIAIDDLKLEHLYVVYPGSERYELHSAMTAQPLGEIGTIW